MAGPVGPYAASAEPSEWHAPYALLGEQAQDPARVAEVPVTAIPAVLVLCAAIQAVLAARPAALAWKIHER